MRALRAAIGLVAIFGATGCASSGLTPASVAPAWASSSLHKEPDAILAVDLAAIRRDPFFGVLAERAFDEKPLGALRNATQIDLFAASPLSHGVWTAAVYGVGDPPPELLRDATREGSSPVYQLRRDAWLTVQPGTWIVSSARNMGRPSPERVSMDGNALLEVWIGPAAIDEGLDQARPDVRAAWRYARSARLIVAGGDRPSVRLAVRFVTKEDAERAADRARRDFDRVVGSSELARQMVALIGDFELAVHGDELDVGVQFSRAFTDYVLEKFGDRRGRRRPDSFPPLPSPPSAEYPRACPPGERRDLDRHECVPGESL